MNTSFIPTLVSAGFPSPGEEWREPPLDIYELLGLASKENSCYIMKTSAMSASGIMVGDVLIASPTIAARNNDIVLAAVNSKMSVRRILSIDDVTFLIPDNPARPNSPRISIMPTDHFLIHGVVLCSIHPLTETSRQALANHTLRTNANHMLGMHLPSIFCSSVNGTSMQGAGVFHGDILIIDRARKAMANDIIIASVDGRFVVKRLLHVKGSIFLLSDNVLTPPVLITQEMSFQIWGVALFSLHLVHRFIKDRLTAQRSQNQ